MTDDTRKTGVWWSVAAAGLLLPVLYVLSFGPADRACKVSGRGWRILRTAYAPVFWLHDATLLKEPLEWYEGVWTPR